MTDQFFNEDLSANNASGDTSNSTVEINVKTLDSQIYTFRVDKNIPVLAFKEKIANEIGLAVGQQRLIFRGKVLKDEHPLSEYHVENGHTLHLVERQPAQPQQSSGASSGEASGSNLNQGNDASAGAPRNRSGQISHSVVLGTFNVGDQGEGGVPDLTRVIGAVLNSIGIGGQAIPNVMSGTQSSTPPVAPGQAPQGGNTSSQSQTGNQAHIGQAFPSQAFQSWPQAMQIPVAAAAVPLPSVNAPIPDSLDTLSEFMNRMELALSQNGGNQQNQPSTNSGDQQHVERASNARGLPTPEALSIVLRRAQRLLNDHAIAALSQIATRLEQDGDSSDPTVRGHVQAESVQVGLAMQHFGALFLELGRTILTLRMGQSPAESVVNAGPAVYVSPSGPNPIMVQPFPLQTSSLFGGSPAPNPVALGPAGVGTAPRHINIHIHAGTSLAPLVSAVGNRANNGEGAVGDRSNGSSLGDSSSGQVHPMRNLFSAVGPFRTAGVAVGSGTLPGVGVSVSQSPQDSVPQSSTVVDVNSEPTNLMGQPQTVETSDRSRAGTDVGTEQGSMTVNNSGLPNVSLPSDNREHDSHKVSNNQDVGSSLKVADESTSLSGSSLSLSMSDDVPENIPGSSKKHESPDGAKTVPLGLGLGGLDRKRRGRQPATSSLDVNQQPQTNGQQILQALASRSSSMNRTSPNNQPSGQPTPDVGHMMDTRPLGEQGSAGQLDISNVMSQVIHSPALNGLLSGVSQQSGVGSPDVLRNMLQQLTQSPQIRNTVNEIAQQVEGQNLGNMFAGTGRGQGGGFDLSRMFQQMMPIVSQALGGGSTSQPFSLESEPDQHFGDGSLGGNNNHGHQSFQIGLQQVAERIESLDPPRDVFRSIIENAAVLHGNEDLINELCSDDSLADEYIEMLCRDLCRRDDQSRDTS